MTFAREGTALERLSARERQTLELVAQGLTNSAIARTMFPQYTDGMSIIDHDSCFVLVC